MAFVITYGPLHEEQTVTRETAQEALEVFTKLRAQDELHITVMYVENDEAAIRALKVLAASEAVAA